MSFSLLEVFPSCSSRKYLLSLYLLLYYKSWECLELWLFAEDLARENLLEIWVVNSSRAWMCGAANSDGKILDEFQALGLFLVPSGEQVVSEQ